MNKRLKKLGFTLMEVNLAIFIMATGVLTMVSLYPLGYRESEQSQEDVKGAAAADAVLNQLTAALSCRNTTYEEWRDAVKQAINVTGTGERSGGWMAYCRVSGTSYKPKSLSQINSLGRNVFNSLGSAYKGSGGKPQWPLNNQLVCAIVVQWGRIPVYLPGKGQAEMRADYSRAAISLRCCTKSGALFAAPIYYTEVHFQGDQKDLK